VWELQYLWERVRVENVMTQRVVTVRPDVPVIAAVRLMLEHRFNSLPVVDASGQIVGMLTEVDIFHLLIQEFEEMSKSLTTSPSEIRVAAIP
jgi:CBS domain-containing protein